MSGAVLASDASIVPLLARDGSRADTPGRGRMRGARERAPHTDRRSSTQEVADVYRVFEALDELVTICEEARGVPMTTSCVVSRGDVLELLDDVREAIPGELDDAQDVLDHRDQLVAEATEEAEQGPVRRPHRGRPHPRRGP